MLISMLKLKLFFVYKYFYSRIKIYIYTKNVKEQILSSRANKIFNETL